MYITSKLIIKIIANRIKPLMNKLVEEKKSSFISGRQTLDNLVIVHEMIHSMKYKSGEKGYGSNKG